jgi:hypothetical protein
MRRLFGRNIPLANGEVAIPREGEFAVGPGLLGRPLDKVVAVFRKLSAVVGDIA